MIYDFGDVEALRLMRAFYKISDPEARRVLLSIAEAATRGATVNLMKAEKDIMKEAEGEVRMN